ncbi:aspartate carbamoyltransferase regulatory subunit [Oscillospiraceae bacterium PP1C4]
MDIYKFLELDKLDCSVAIIKNARSKKSGKKDIIKIENKIDIDLDVLGFIDPSITVNIIDGGQIIKKTHLTLPKEIVNVAKCKNPRCITSVEQELSHIFHLVESEHSTYRCIYCEQEYDANK